MNEKEKQELIMNLRLVKAKTGTSFKQMAEEMEISYNVFRHFLTGRPASQKAIDAMVKWLKGTEEKEKGEGK